MKENNKDNRLYVSKSCSSILRKKNVKQSHVLLKTNYKNFPQYTIESKDMIKLQFTKNLNNSQFPIIHNNQHNSFINNDSKNDMNNTNENYLKLLLHNSINFDSYQKAVMESKYLNKTKSILPPVYQEERKDNNKKYDTFFNEIINSTGPIKNIHKSKKLNNKKYSFCLKTLCEINNNKNYSISKLKGAVNNQNNKIYNIPKNRLLREIILNEYVGQDLNYEQQNILRDYRYYNKYIKKILLELKREIPLEENVHRSFEKIYKNSKYNKPILNLYSLSISFNCKGKYHLFHIPFEYLPLFYYKNMSYLKFILISIFKFENNFEDIIIDFDEIIYILSCCKQFDIKPDEELDKKEQNIPEEPKKEQMSFTSKINNKGYENKLSCKKLNNHMYNFESPTIVKKGTVTPKESFKMNNTVKVKNKNDSKNNTKLSKNKKGKKEQNELKIEESNLYKCVYNKFLFKWNTPKYNYDITVKTPEAVFQVGKTVIRAYIDIELIFFLLENKFTNWDFYISQYIFSYKECHRNINELISVKSMVNIFPNILKSIPTVKDTLNKKDMNEQYTNTNKVNNLISDKVHQVSDKSKKYEFLYTDKNNINYIKILHNFFITSRCRAFIKNKFCFDFNFFHMKILNKILRIQGLNFFLKKLICIDRETLSLKFRYDELTSLANEQYKVLEKHEPNINGSQTCLRMKERNKDVINFTISFPVLETVKYNNQNYEECFESDYNDVIFDGIPLDTLDELCKNDFNEWSNILLK